MKSRQSCARAKKLFHLQSSLYEYIFFPSDFSKLQGCRCCKTYHGKPSRISYDIFKEAYDECMQHHEECWVMFLNQANRLLGLSCISKCGISQTVVDVRIILQTALLAHASGIILSHNHPSGNMVASSNDNAITSKLKKACELLDITLLDHIILSDTGYLSYADEGML